MTDKFCINCAWSEKPLFNVYRHCSLPGAVAPDPVDGYKNNPLCDVARRPGKRCGPEGKCWEPKPTFWQRFMARVYWWTGQDYNSRHLK